MCSADNHNYLDISMFIILINLRYMLYTYTILQPKVVIFLEICCVKIDQLDYAIFSIYSKAINGTKWQNFERLTVANSMILFSETPKVSGMLKALKKIPQLYILGKRTVC